MRGWWSLLWLVRTSMVWRGGRCSSLMRREERGRCMLLDEAVLEFVSCVDRR